jgi:hypothetical protein
VEIDCRAQAAAVASMTTGCGKLMPDGGTSDVGTVPGQPSQTGRGLHAAVYALVRLTYGESANPATSKELGEPLSRLYCYLYDEPEDAHRPAARCSRWSTPP